MSVIIITLLDISLYLFNINYIKLIITYRNLVRHATARVISAVGKIELPSGSWNELFQFLYQCCQSPHAIQREVNNFIIRCDL